MERRKNVEKWASVFWEGRVAAVADYEKHQQTQQWPSLTLLHTRTVKVTITKGTRRRRRIKRRERRIPRRHQPVADAADADASNSFFFSRLQLLFFFSRRCVHFFISFLSFVRSNVGRRRNDDINKTLSDAKNIIYMTSKPQKRT